MGVYTCLQLSIVVIPNLQCSKLSRPAGDRLTAHTCARNETEMKILSISNFLGSRWKGPLVWDLECCVARNGPHTLACFKMLVQVFSRGLDTLWHFAILREDFAIDAIVQWEKNGKDDWSQDVTAMPPCKGAPWARVVSDLANTVRSRRVTAQKKIRKRLIKLIKLIMFQYVSICFIDLMLDMPESCWNRAALRAFWDRILGENWLCRIWQAWSTCNTRS